jgi:transcriptional regulator with XRE-family HTH domain
VIRDLDQGGAGFGGLLRRLRAAAGLTQEELAEAAQVGARSVSDLERSVSRTARPQTARRLVAALGLAGPELTEFVAAARGPVPPQAHPRTARGQLARRRRPGRCRGTSPGSPAGPASSTG